MNILIVSEFFPSADKEITGGVENRAYNTAKQLSRDNKVYVFTSFQPKRKKEETLNRITIRRFGPQFPYSSTGNLFERAI